MIGEHLNIANYFSLYGTIFSGKQALGGEENNPSK